MLCNHKCESPQKKTGEEKRDFILRDTESDLDFLQLQYNCYLEKTTLSKSQEHQEKGKDIFLTSIHANVYILILGWKLVYPKYMNYKDKCLIWLFNKK